MKKEKRLCQSFLGSVGTAVFYLLKITLLQASISTQSVA